MTTLRSWAPRLRGLLAPTLEAMPPLAAACVRAHLEREGADLGPSQVALESLLAGIDETGLAGPTCALVCAIALLAIAERELALVGERAGNEPTPGDVQAILAGDVALAFGYRALGELPDALHVEVLAVFAESARTRLAATRGAAAGAAAPGEPVSVERLFESLSHKLSGQLGAAGRDGAGCRVSGAAAELARYPRYAGAHGR